MSKNTFKSRNISKIIFLKISGWKGIIWEERQWTGSFTKDDWWLH